MDRACALITLTVPAPSPDIAPVETVEGELALTVPVPAVNVNRELDPTVPPCAPDVALAENVNLDLALTVPPRSPDATPVETVEGEIALTVPVQAGNVNRELDPTVPPCAPDVTLVEPVDHGLIVTVPPRPSEPAIAENANLDDEISARFPSIINMSGLSRSQRKNIPEPGRMTHNQKRKYRRTFKNGRNWQGKKDVAAEDDEWV